mmetsp:Transcript_16552/g.34156  ORF Transcript_16552/g.34156 Transcript_16552/m.34156 type:complete len:687 (-) Transcript_16552:18-2078(-)
MFNKAQKYLKKMRTATSVVQGEISVGLRLFDMKTELGDSSASEDVEKIMEAKEKVELEEAMKGHHTTRVSRPYKPKSYGTWLYLEIESCKGLGKADRFGQSDPFVVIKLGNIELARTQVINDCANPEWFSECFEFPDSHFKFDEIELKMEVWDMDMAEVGSFLGCAYFSKEDFKFSDEIVTITKTLTKDTRAGGNGIPDIPSSRPVISFFQRMASHNDPESLGFTGLNNRNKTAGGIAMSFSGKGEGNEEEGDGGARNGRATWDRLKTKVKENVKDMGSYKVPNPQPTRRNQRSRLTYENVKSSRSTVFACVGLIVAYLLLGMIAFSYIFEGWDAVDSLYFSVVTFTTVGYGDLYPGCEYTKGNITIHSELSEDDPKRAASQMFCCIFSLLGIAIIGYALQILGQQFVQNSLSAMENAANNQKPVNMINSQFDFEEGDSEEVKEKKMIQSAILAKEKEEKQKMDDLNERRKAITKILLPILALFIVGALVFGILEDWPFVQSLYWCVITAASIGYGEFSPKKQSSRALAIIFIPISVACIGQGLAGIVNIFIEEEIKKANLKLMGRELTIEDLDSMNTDDDGEVSELEFVEFMLKTMKKVDQTLLNDLHSQFRKMDADGSGSLQKSDLELLAKRKLAVRRKLTLAAYKADLTTKARVASERRDPGNAPKMSAIMETPIKAAKISPE